MQLCYDFSTMLGGKGKEMKQIFRALMTGVLCVLGGVTHAAAVIVPYSGIYNEVSQAPGGDYDAIGGLVDVGQFNLQAGNNFFTGGIKTPSDSSDAFLVGIGSGLKLIGATITWGTNANDFMPYLLFPDRFGHSKSLMQTPPSFC